MKTHTLLFALLVSLAFERVIADAPQAEEKQVSQEWRAAKDTVYSAKPVKAEDVAKVGRAYKKLVGGQSRAGKEKLAPELVNFTTALAWAKEGDFEKAYAAFVEEVATQADAGRKFLENTRNPSFFAKDVFALHSQIIAATGHTEPIPNLGYEFFVINGGQKAKQIAFIYGTDEKDESGVALDGISDREQRYLIYLMAPNKHGRYVVADHAEVIGDRDGFSVSLKRNDAGAYLALSGVTKVVEYKGELEIPFVHPSPQSKIELRVHDGKIEQPLQALNR